MRAMTERARRLARRTLVLAAAAGGIVAGAVPAAGALAAGGPAAAGPVSTTPPTISGAPVVGQTLQAAHATWSSDATSYNDWWMRCAPSGYACTIISGADALGYTPTAADVGHTLAFGEIAYDAGGRPSRPAYSSATALVLATPPRHFVLVGPTGIPQYALYIVEPAGRRPTVHDWQQAIGHADPVGHVDADVAPGQTIYFNATASIGKPFGTVRSMLTPEGPSGTPVHVTASTPSTVRVVLPRPEPAFRPGLSAGERFVLGALNAKRRRLGESPLRVSTVLDQVASAAARDEAVHHRFPDPYLFSLAPAFGWPGELTATAMANLDAPLAAPAQVLAHWDGAFSGESTGLWDEIRWPFYSYVGIGDGGGAWNLVLVAGCPATAGDPVRACGLTNVTGP